MFPFFLQALSIKLKSAFSLSFTVAFLLLPIFILALGRLFNREDGLRIQIGLLETQAPIAHRITQSLASYGQQDCDFIGYTDEEQLKQDVAAHRLECAFVFTEGVEALETEGVIRIYRSDATMTEKALELLVAAAYMEALSGELGAASLADYVEADATVLAADIQARTESYLQKGTRMDMQLVESGQKEKTAAPYRRLFHGLAGLFALLTALLCVMGFSGDTEAAVLKRIQSAGQGTFVYRIAEYAATGVTVALFLVLTLAGGGLCFPNLLVSAATEVFMGVCLAVAGAGMALLLRVGLRADYFPAFIALVFVLAALLGGAIFDIREIAAAAGFLRYLFPNTFYLDGLMRPGAAFYNGLCLLGIGLVTGGLTLSLTRRRLG